MRRVFCLAILAVLLPVAAQAATCTVSATGIAFGTYIPSNASPTDRTGRVSVRCTSLVLETISYTIRLNAGVNSGGNFANRKMANGASRLSYQIYRNSARTIVWGDGTGGTSTVTDSYLCVALCNITRNYTTYGRLPGLQWTASPGAHTDTITVTVTY